jgi:hypothetical protein
MILADFKAVSLNALHSSMKIIDEFYSILQDEEVRDRIFSLNKKSSSGEDEDEIIEKFKRFLEWGKGN